MPSESQSLPPNANQNYFQLGLTMSGAISAGAYTAGVFDFLIQALDEWEAAIAHGDGPDGAVKPPHRIGLKVMSGASAGAITAAIGAVALGTKNIPKKFDSPKPGKSGTPSQQYEYIFDRLYRAWVEKPTLVAADGNDMLALRDLTTQAALVPPGRVASLLDSTLLDEIATGAIAKGQPAEKREYVSSPLHIYLTLSNLRGTPYNVAFGANGQYGMMAHGDRVYYRIAGIGGWASSSKFADADKDTSIELDIAKLTSGPSPDWRDYAMSAVASGAFPVGLSPRTTPAVRSAYATRQFPVPEYGTIAAMPLGFPQLAAGASQSVAFTTVDGGVIDNDPFEYARFTLMEIPPKPNPSDPMEADRAVIMIAPFPELPAFPAEGKPPSDLIGIVAALLPALIAQARFKPSELFLAGNEEHASRYLIGPRRVPEEGPPRNPAKDDPQKEAFGIASGLLHGFGGFLAREFRDHDFQLGRRNCQRFLADTFALPPNSKMFPPAWVAAYGDRPEYQASKLNNDGSRWLRIIPLVGEAAKEVPTPVWPRLDDKEFEKVIDRMGSRFRAVVTALSKQNLQKKRLLMAAALAAFFAKPRVLEAVKYYILADLVRRDQIQGWELPDWDDAPKVRAVLAELLGPANALRQVSDLALAVGMSERDIQNILDRCLSVADDKPYKVWKAPWDASGKSLYALAQRKPNMVTEARQITKQWWNNLFGMVKPAEAA
jgi:hypothetical protein